MRDMGLRAATVRTRRRSAIERTAGALTEARAVAARDEKLAIH